MPHVVHVFLFHLCFEVLPLEKCLLLPLREHDNKLGLFAPCPSPSLDKRLQVRRLFEAYHDVASSNVYAFLTDTGRDNQILRPVS